MKQINVWTLAVVALFLVLLVPMINIAYESSADRTTVENETILVDYDDPQQVDAADDAFEFDDNVTVTNSTGATLEGGTDYEWNASNGKVAWYNTSSTTEGENASISYGYLEHSQTSQNIAAILRPLSAPLGPLILVIAVGSAVYYAFGRGGGW